MAKNVGVIGAMKGKVGNMVFRTRRGMQIASVYQPVVHNPKSARQELSRAKMALATSTLRPLGRFLKIGLGGVAPTYELQRAIGRCIPVDNAVIQIDQQGELTFSAVEAARFLSSAEFGPVRIQQFSVAEEGTVTVVPYAPDGMNIDESGNNVEVGFVTAVVNRELGTAIIQQNVFEGQLWGSVEVQVPVTWSGMSVDVYCFAKQIPNAINGISSITTPWMFPAKTSQCVGRTATLA